MGTEEATRLGAKPALVRASKLNKHYVQRALFSRKKFVVNALVDVDFEVAPGCMTALIGESGSGKSTLAACLAMIERTDAGKIWFEGREISRLDRAELAALRPKIQMVFQDSAGALNPRFSAAEIVAEPLEIQRKQSARELQAVACELMKEVGLSPDWAARRPLEFSGGQRQRLAIARAIALKPSLLILDESLSGLDLSTQAQILNLLLDLQSEHGLSYLLISHDLTLVSQVADFIAVMHKGKIVEQGPRADMTGNPQHEVTRRLLISVRIQGKHVRAAGAGA